MPKSKRSNVDHRKVKGLLRITKKDFLVSETDRITYCFETDKNKTITRVVNVSYEVFIQNKWETIVRFDSDHGYLHRHTKILLANKTTLVDQDNLIQKGSPNHWLTWSIKHLTHSHRSYKRKFFRRNNLME